MRIERRDRTMERNRQLGADIAEAAFTKGVDGRVCGEQCILKCSQCGSSTCQCDCAPECPEAPRALSADPDRYPVEPGITPLVFEMKRLGLVRPCWSCEGHLRPDGSLWKVPAVWFYAKSLVHVRLLASGLERMRHAGKLSVSWRIAVTFSDPDNPETTFSLEPVRAFDNEPSLPALRNDVAEIARSLHGMMTGEARTLQRDAGKALAGNG